jgi:hypothetical protein
VVKRANERSHKPYLPKSSVSRWLGLLALILSNTVATNATGQEKGHTFGNPDVLQWAPTRTYHVENYKLNLHFDQPKTEVFGDELITLRPFGPHFHKFYLNRSELTIDSVTLEQAGSSPFKLPYDSFYPIQEVGEELVGVFDLSQFEADIQTQAQEAPMAMQREAAQKVLERLHNQR